MEFKTNPAPWLVRDGFIYGSNGNLVAESHGYEGDNYLIAAAPELLEALIELTESAKEAIDGLGDLADAIDTAKAAIAKALGQQ
ncbi:hypothetical protein [Providencia stuartii]|uniref:hypothetical protein n=1 Tax=Providencia stuartii TaxID=588 RepID=UPI000CE6631F|nr:hypothetical protein [Providencia stuartii]AVE42433.1 hypothetical protein AM353_11705 [Providencia stuartii]